MGEWIRRIRGTIGMGLTWAAAWMPIGALLALVLWVMGFDPVGFVGMLITIFGALGFVGGSIFSGVLRLAEGRRRFDELSLLRFAAWGGVGGLLLGGLAGIALFGGPGLQWTDAVIAGVTTALGAGSAVGTLALARRAEDESPLTDGGGLGKVRPGRTETGRLPGGRG
ncbi:MAG: hypothetical protein PVI57_03455 [Gemmatimonadota bacterium]|jgi:hypothetical protein